MGRPNKEERLNVRISKGRNDKLKRIAEERDTTKTHMVEAWIDRLEEGKKPH